MKRVLQCLAVLLIVAGIGCGVVAFLHYRAEQNAGEEYETLREQVKEPEPEQEPVQEEVPEEDPVSYTHLRAHET